jgi:hypothetical protein
MHHIINSNRHQNNVSTMIGQIKKKIFTYIMGADHRYQFYINIDDQLHIKSSPVLFRRFVF